MALKLENWRKEEAGLEEVIEKYPDVSRFVILKTDVHLRGYVLSEKAFKKLDPSIYQTEARGVFGDKLNVPHGLILRDGTIIVGGYEYNLGIRDPYLIDVVDGRLVLTDQGKVLEEVEYWRKPDFFDKTTTKGTPMFEILGCRPQRLNMNLNRHCHFWDTPGEGCKYCSIGAVAADDRRNNRSPLLDLDEIYETVKEALKQEGRFTSICATMGSILSGKELFDDEVDLYIRVMQKIQPLFTTKKIRIQLVATAYSKEQLERIRDHTGIFNYTSDLEVLNKELFEWICPGKARNVGYEGWKQRIYDAVDVFGKGQVNAGIIGGLELARPNGFKTEDEALASTLAEAEELAKHGVSTVNTVWTVGSNTMFAKQVPPSLEYYVRLAKGLNDIREAYDIPVYFDDYRRCGNHPGSDLARI